MTTGHSRELWFKPIPRCHLVRFYWDNKKIVVTDQILGHQIYFVWVKQVLSLSGSGDSVEIRLNDDGMPLDIHSQPIHIFQRYEDPTSPDNNLYCPTNGIFAKLNKYETLTPYRTSAHSGSREQYRQNKPGIDSSCGTIL
jgi:hypothetical protein